MNRAPAAAAGTAGAAHSSPQAYTTSSSGSRAGDKHLVNERGFLKTINLQLASPPLLIVVNVGRVRAVDVAELARVGLAQSPCRGELGGLGEGRQRSRVEGAGGISAQAHIPRVHG